MNQYLNSVTSSNQKIAIDSMIELMITGDVTLINNKVVLAGTTHLGITDFNVLLKILVKTNLIYYIDKNRISREVNILDTKTNTSVANNLNIYLLTDESIMENTPENLTPIYCRDVK